MPLRAVILSFFSNRGKKSALQAWQAYPEATEASTALCSTPSDVPKTVMESLKRFVVLMYDRTSELQGADVLQDVEGDRKHSSNSSGSIRTHEEIRLQSRPYLGSVPRPLSMCYFTRRLGLGDM